MVVCYFLMGALALLVAVLLCGFVGCAAIAGLGDPYVAADDYPSAVFKTGSQTGSMVAYWRLTEPAATPVPSLGGAAKSQVGGYDGDYHKLSPVGTPDPIRFSDRTYGKITLGAPGLLQHQSSAVTNTSVHFQGGYVQVPFDEHLNPPKFTLEAWVHLPIVTGEYYRCLVESTGPQGLGPKLTGWGLYLGPKDSPPIPTNLVDAYWQIWMGDGAQFKQVAVSKKPAEISQLMYLALTFDGSRISLFLYYPDTGQQLDIPSLLALTAKVTGFQRNDTSTNGQGDFCIGAGSNLFPSAGPPAQRLYPLAGNIQEVALYNIDLSGGAPDFPGLVSTLMPHEFSGGNL